ncbi:MAG TPA: hypothetical protein VGT82_12715 [Ktedonobacteraceae bacterium]|nr:hypothetical protein [Ktedonobacteraceae bacterium]
MNCTLWRSVDTDAAEFDERFVQDVITDIENTYVTMPMAVVKPVFQQEDEEELHTSFEEAISDRLLALHPRLDRISQSLPSAHDNDTVECQAIRVQGKPQGLFLNVNMQQRITIFACFALMFMLSGFDLMGMLVLHMH